MIFLLLLYFAQINGQALFLTGNSGYIYYSFRYSTETQVWIVQPDEIKQDERIAVSFVANSVSISLCNDPNPANCQNATTIYLGYNNNNFFAVKEFNSSLTIIGKAQGYGGIGITWQVAKLVNCGSELTFTEPAMNFSEFFFPTQAYPSCGTRFRIIGEPSQAGEHLQIQTSYISNDNTVLVYDGSESNVILNYPYNTSPYVTTTTSASVALYFPPAQDLGDFWQNEVVSFSLNYTTVPCIGTCRTVHPFQYAYVLMEKPPKIVLEYQNPQAVEFISTTNNHTILVFDSQSNPSEFDRATGVSTIHFDPSEMGLVLQMISASTTRKIVSVSYTNINEIDVRFSMGVMVPN